MNGYIILTQITNKTKTLAQAYGAEGFSEEGYFFSDPEKAIFFYCELKKSGFPYVDIEIVHGETENVSLA